MPTKTSGTSASIGTTETDLFTPIVSDSYHSCSINLDVLQSGDVFVFRLYGYDDVTTTYELELTETKSGVQTETILRFNPVASSHYKITAQKISGTNRTFNFTRWV